MLEKALSLKWDWADLVIYYINFGQPVILYYICYVLYHVWSRTPFK